MRPRKRINLIIIIVSIVVLAIATIATLYYTTDIFKSNEEMFYKYFAKNESIKEIAKSNKVNSLIISLLGDTPYESKGKVNINSYNEESILNKMTLEVDAKVNNGEEKQNVSANLKYDNMNLSELLYGREKDMYAIKSEEIVTAYLGTKNERIDELAEKLGNNNDYIPEKIQSYNYNSLIEISDTEKQIISQTYFSLLTSNIGKEKFSKQKNVSAQIEGINYDLVEYSLILSEDEAKNILNLALQTLKQDSVTLNVILSKAKIITQNQYLKIEDITNLIDEQIENLQNLNTEEGKNIKINVYAFKDELIKTEIEFRNNVITLINKTEGTVENVEISLKNEEQSNVVIIKKEETADQANIKITINKIDNKGNGSIYSIDLDCTLKGNIENNDLEQMIEISFGEDEKIYVISLNNIMSFSDNIETNGLENETVVDLNDYSADDLQVLKENITNKVKEIIEQKKQLIATAQ